MGLFDRLRRGHAPTAEPEPETPERTVVEIDASSLSRVFSAPMWLRDLGLLAWFLVGVGILLFGLTWLLGLTSTITMPVVVGAILATVAGPLVTKIQQHRIPRPAGAAIVLLGLIALGIIIFLMVVGGIVEQSSEIKKSLNEAVDKIQGWVNDAGANGTSGVTESAKSGTANSGHELLHGLGQGIKDLTSLIFFVTFSAFATFFLLKDGPTVRGFIDRHLGVPVEVATVITGNVIKSLRRYFLGVTIVAAFNAVVIGLTAIILGVPLAGTIAVVVFVTAYVPFIGAFVSGAFAVLLGNGLLQNIVQPIAFGATLDLNPLVVLIVTIGFGSIFGMVGLVLAAPLTSAALHITRELAQARAKEAERAPPEAEAEPAGA